MRGVRRSARGEAARKAARELDQFATANEVFHLTRARSELCHRTRGAASARRRRPFSTFELASSRESGRTGGAGFSPADRAHVGSRHIPTKGPWGVDEVDSEAYVSQFSADGSLLVAGFRGSRIRVYNAERGWKIQKDISCRSLQWTVSDIALSPNQQFLAYSSLSPVVHIVNVQSSGRESHANVNEIHEGLDFTSNEHDDDDFGIFSVNFSKDGKEVVIGNSERSIYVYDLASNKVSVRIRAHMADVNAVTFADESGNVLYSGSDDSLCKVWDRRCLVGGKSAGILTGHLDGVTFIDSRGDGRYFISNCKDQRIKLWDIRKMSSVMRGSCFFTIYFLTLTKFYLFILVLLFFRHPRRLVEWDYRWMPFPSEAHHYKHPDDQSLATYRGHSVLRTLIRCYFSPMHSTGQRYIYTGSSDKSVYIYDLATGKTVERLSWHGSIIRDCTWHPYYPTLVSSSWDGYVARWEASGDDNDPSILAADEQRAYGDPFMM